MPAVAIPFHDSQASGQSELGGFSPLQENTIVDGGNAMTVFPGTSAWSYFPTTIPNASSVIGAEEFEGNLVYVTADRKVWAVTASGFASEISTATVTLEGAGIPVFAKTSARLFIAGGGKLAYWDGVGTFLAEVADADAPLTTHVAAVVQRIVAFADATGDIVWTDVGVGNELTGWNALNFVNAEARPDPVIALHENSRQIFAWGTETLQCFEPDPSVIFQPYPADNAGLGAKYSVINLLEKKSFAWLNQYRRFVIGSGRGEIVDIAEPMARDLDNLVRVDDAIGWRFVWNDHDFLIWKFPTAGKTFCFDIARKRWIELGARSAAGDRIPWPVQSIFRWADRGETVAGLSTGAIQVFNKDATTVGGSAFIGRSETGYRGHGSSNLKDSVELRLRARRGTSDSPPTVPIEYRDQPGPWKRVDFSLGNLAQTETTINRPYVSKPYRARQWAVTIPPTHEVTMVEEQFIALEE